MTCAFDPQESAECRQAHQDYDRWHYEYLRLVGVINNLKSHRNTGGGVTLAGVALLAVPGIGWLPGAIVAVGGAAYGAAAWVALQRARTNCQTALNNVYDAYRRTHQHCEKDKCKLPRPTLTCP